MLFSPIKQTFVSDQKREKSLSQSTQTVNLISEIVVPKTPDSLQLVLPSLAYLSRTNNKQWLTWITDSPLPINLLQHFEFSLKHLRVVYVSDTAQMKAALIKVLQDDSSHAVIASPGKLSQKELQHFEASAQIGNTRAVLVRYNQL